jgi:hypothetical protein
MLVDGGRSVVVPYGADQTIYVVVDRCGPTNIETQLERADLATVVDEFMAGRFVDPVRVVAFNTLEHWSKDLSFDVALEVQARCDIEGMPVPDHMQDFLNANAQAVGGRGGPRRF